jgi:hypothetical protein
VCIEGQNEKMKDVDVEKIEAVMEAILFTMGEL